MLAQVPQRAPEFLHRPGDVGSEETLDKLCHPRESLVVQTSGSVSGHVQDPAELARISRQTDEDPGRVQRSLAGILPLIGIQVWPPEGIGL